MKNKNYFLSFFVFVIILVFNSLHIFSSGLYYNWETITFVPGDWQSHWATIFDTCIDRFGKTDNIFKCAEGFDNRIISPYPFGYLLLYVQESFGLSLLFGAVIFSILHFILYIFILNYFINLTNNVKYLSIILIFFYIFFSPSSLISIHTYYKDIWLFSGISLMLFCFSFLRRNEFLIIDYFKLSFLMFISIVILLLGRNSHIMFAYLGFFLFFIYITINYKRNFFKNILLFSILFLIMFSVKSLFPTTLFFKSLIFDPEYIQWVKYDDKINEINIEKEKIKEFENKVQDKQISNSKFVKNNIKKVLENRILKPQIYFYYTRDSSLNYDHSHYLIKQQYFKYIFSHLNNSILGPEIKYYFDTKFSFFKISILIENIILLIGLVFLIYYLKKIKNKQYNLFIFTFFILSVCAIEFNNFNYGTFIRHRYFFWKMLSCYGLLLFVNEFLINKYNIKYKNYL